MNIILYLSFSQIESLFILSHICFYSDRFVLFDPNTKLWHEVSEEYAREKVSHSLRSRSSTDQKIANAASNSIKMLNNAVHQHNDSGNENNNSTGNTVVIIAPRTGQDNGSQSSSSSLAGETTPKASKTPIGQPSTPAMKSTPKTKSASKTKTPTTSSSRKKSSPSKTPSGHKTTRSKHLKPGLDEIVQRLIKDQQSLLRAMIQKETERFTSAAAMGGASSSSSSTAATRAMPLSYKAEASAVSKLTASLPKMGKALKEPSRGVVNPPNGGATTAATEAAQPPATAAATTAANA